MAKKKWKFTDLSDDESLEENNNSIENNETINKETFNLNINDFSQKKESIKIENNKDLFETNSDKKEILIDSVKTIENKNVNLNHLNENNNVEKIIKNKIENSKVEEYQSKYDINIDYDSEIPIKQQIKQQQSNKLNNTENNKIRTFNETLNNTIQTNNDEFNSNKIQQFFTTKEKLDVKTNIYLKPNLVSEIQILAKKTGESRSAIINKLIEHALKDIKSR